MDNISKIRTLLDMAREALVYHINEAEQRHEKERLIRPDRDIVARIEAALAEPVGNEFRRGAEAMREAAALCAEREETQLPLHVASAIRALPVPEDK